ncbi:ComEC family competence protein [Elizabethkingia argentiflava]|uniref:ComEC family competence protein n=1 Tax=Elizabethkingia argenteiflava TaxID=2681556 RepID=A0A845PSQ9_9FLAO|nr:ComEC/Rec2 family competence protein [Elizabethkingia argenteiflava]NAW51289.1 ComEC family competence protein [Elizabethkingia argenteiflava]
MKKQPIFCLFIAFIVGIFIQDKIPQIYNGVVLILIFLLIPIVSRFFPKFRKRILLLVSFFILLGFIAHFVNTLRRDYLEFKGKKNLVFNLRKKLNSKGESYRRYLVSIEGIQGESSQLFPFYAVVIQPKNQETFDFKHTYSGSFYLNKIKKTQNKYQFDYRAYMLRSGVEYQLLSRGSVVAHQRDVGLIGWLRQYRLVVLQNIDESTLSSQTKAFLKAIILADRTDMDTQLSRDFITSGLIHLLAISGTHMVIIFGFFMGVFRLILLVRYRRLAIILSLALIWCFALFIDYANSVVRACLMLSFYYIMILLQRTPDLRHSIGLAGFVILLADTQQLFDIGFQLSFLAVLGIEWLNQPFLSVLPRARNNFYKFLFQLMSISLAAQLITLPVILYYFHQFSLISIISNMLVVPLAEVIIVYSLLMVVVLALFTDMVWLNFIYDHFIQSLLQLIHGFAEVNFLFFQDVSLNLLEVGLLFILIFLLRFLLIEKNLISILRFGFVGMLFFLLRLGLDIQAFHQKDFLEHEYGGRKIFSIQEKAKARFYVPEDMDKEGIKYYIIKPYMILRRIKKYEVFYFNPNLIKGLEYQNERKFVK